MMKKIHKNILLLSLMGVFTPQNLKAVEAPIFVEANACENKKVTDSEKATEYRAVDKASVTAIRTSGIIQKQAPNINPAVMDIVSYQLIDEYLFNVKHEVTHLDSGRVCVSLTGELTISENKLKSLIDEHKDIGVFASGNPNVSNEYIASEVANEVQQETTFKPTTLNEKKLIYIADMLFWDGSATKHYSDLLKEVFDQSEYYYVTGDKNVADFVAEPKMSDAVVDKIDDNNHKMKMTIELKVSSPHIVDFSPITLQQNHFILFSASKDEQEVADTLIRKLLLRSANDVNGKLAKFLQNDLENKKVRGK